MGAIRNFFSYEEFSNEELKALHESIKFVEKNFKEKNLNQVTKYVKPLLAEIHENKSRLYEDPKFNVTDYKLLEKLGDRLERIQSIIQQEIHPIDEGPEKG